MHGDYYLPNLGINEEEPTYGKYGIMRKQFLKEHRSARYQYLVLTGKLTEHLNQVDKEVREKIEMLAVVFFLHSSFSSLLHPSFYRLSEISIQIRTTIAPTIPAALNRMPVRTAMFMFI